MGPETTNLMTHRPSQSIDSFVWAMHFKFLNFKVFGGKREYLEKSGVKTSENLVFHKNNKNTGKNSTN